MVLNKSAAFLPNDTIPTQQESTIMEPLKALSVAASASSVQCSPNVAAPPPLPALKAIADVSGDIVEGPFVLPSNGVPLLRNW